MKEENNMAKFINVVKYKIKDGSKDVCLKKINEMPKYEDLISSKYIETGANSYCFIGEWVSKGAYKTAYPKLIEFLDTIRNFLKEISPELGVTDPVSGPVVIEK